MSLTILSQPTLDHPFEPVSIILQAANNDSWYVVSGTTFGTPGVTQYKYVADVYVDTVLEATLKSFPDPDTGFGVFNLRNVASNFVSYDLPLSGDTEGVIFRRAPNSKADVQLFFREEYLSGSTFVDPSGTTSSSIVSYINSSLDYTKAVTINWADYVMAGGQVGLFLQSRTNFRSDFPVTPAYSNGQPFYAYPDLRQWLSYCNANGTVTGLKVITQDAFFNTINTYFFSNPYRFDPDGIQIVATGMPELSLLINDWTGVFYYRATLTINNTTSEASQSVTYQIKDNCGMYAPDARKLYWLGSFGEFNSWYFLKKNETTISKTQSTFKKIPGKVNTQGKVVQNTYDSSMTPFYTALNDSTVLTTDFLSDNDVVFLKGIFQSPAVWMEDEDGIITNVTINQDSYVLNKRVNNRSYSLALTVQSSVQNFSQLI